ncbi:MAG: hypothetical protein HOI95_24725 [Chromatiales bacterium]|jgi:hypothetical protein|nr:hypothetical protein [Chromatiales bacterium]
MRGLVLYVIAVSFALSANWPGAALGQELGRLFSSPKDRRALDAARDAYDPTRQEIIVKHGAAEAAPEPPPPLPKLNVQGVVIRSNGHVATWVNGTTMLSGESTPDGVRIEADGDAGAVRFVMPTGQGTALIKPGQRLDPNVGEVSERYSGPGEAAEKATGLPLGR